MHTFSAVVVTRDREAKMARALHSLERLKQSSPLLQEIIVVDNASSRPVPAHAATTLIRNESPRGVAYNRNRGSAAAGGDFLIFMDDDAWIEDLDLDRIAEYFERHPRVALIAPRILYPDGRLQESIRAFPSLRALAWRGLQLYRWRMPMWYRSYIDPIPDRAHRTEPCAIDWAIGACLIIRATAFRESGCFDEGYTFGYEDADLAVHLRAAGHDVEYFPNARVIHEYARESARLLRRSTARHAYSIVRFLARSRALAGSG